MESISLYSVNLVRELRDNSLFVPGFLTSELIIIKGRLGLSQAIQSVLVRLVY